MSRRGEVRDLSTSRRQRPRRNQGWDVGRRQQMEEPKKNRRKIPRDKRIEGKCMAHTDTYTRTQTHTHTRTHGRTHGRTDRHRHMDTHTENLKRNQI